MAHCPRNIHDIATSGSELNESRRSGGTLQKPVELAARGSSPVATSARSTSPRTSPTRQTTRAWLPRNPWRAARGFFDFPECLPTTAPAKGVGGGRDRGG